MSDEQNSPSTGQQAAVNMSSTTDMRKEAEDFMYVHRAKGDSYPGKVYN